MSNNHGDQPGGLLRPGDVFRAAEGSAIKIRKLLSGETSRTAASESLDLMHDAVRLAELVEKIANRGQKVPAAEAIQLAEYVERLIALLHAELDELLACGCEHGVE